MENEKFKTLKKPFIVEPHLAALLKVIKKANGQAILVGGAVRDFLFGLHPKDIDLEVYGLNQKELEDVLTKNFNVINVGKSFGIFLVTVELNKEKKSFDVALPRTENKINEGHKGFLVTTDKNLSFKVASKRRDFTINAMGIDIERNLLYDPHDGLTDLKHGILRHVSDAFSEDPLRVLRAAQLCARFMLYLHPDTILLCQKLKDELKTLSKERIYAEIKKLLLSKKPSMGFKVLLDTQSIDLFLPLKALIDCPQEEEWHPEGDVWVHTLMVIDEASRLLDESSFLEEEKLIIMAAALCHDLGKPLVTSMIDGRMKSPGHEEAGVIPTVSLLKSFGFGPNFIEEVLPLVKEHLKPHQLYRAKDEITDGAIRRLSARVNIEKLLIVSKADFCGRTTKEALSKIDPSHDWLLKKSHELNVQKQSPKPILMGRHLMALGILPGKEMGILLKKAMEAQLDGLFNDEKGAILFIKDYLNKAG